MATGSGVAPPSTARDRWVAGALLALCALLAAIAAADWLPGTRVLLFDVAYVALTLFAAASCGFAARRSAGRTRVGWGLVAAGAAAWVPASGLWFWYGHVEPAASWPTVADAFYLAMYPPMLAGLLVLGTRRLAAPGPWRTVLDGLIVLLALVITTWEGVLEPALSSGHVGALARTASVAYPVADLLLVWVVLGLLGTGFRAGARLLGPLAVGLLVYGLADLAYAYRNLHGTYEPAGPVDVGWLVGYALLALAARRARAWEGEPRPESARGYWLLAGIVALSAAVALREAFGHDADPVVLWAFSILLGLALVRQVLAVIENDRLRSLLERRVAERTADLARLHAEQESIIVSAADAILRVDAEGRVVFANPAARDMLHLAEGHTGVSLREHVGLPVTDASAFTGAGELEWRRPDGRALDLEYTTTPVVDGGTTVGYVVVARDATQRRALERMRMEFVSVVSHELRTPLTSLHGALALLSGGALEPASPRGRRMIDIASASTLRLTRLVQDVLDVARLGSGRLQLAPRPCDAAALATAAVDAMRPFADEAGVVLGVDVEPATVAADPDRVHQVFVNLIGNAVKFSPPGGTVTVVARPVSSAGTAVFQVRDQGRGIPADDLERVFEPFHQVDASDDREKGGTGLGLTISRGIVERHGGTIRAESVPGRGATFTFTLPLAAAAPPAAPARPVEVRA